MAASVWRVGSAQLTSSASLRPRSRPAASPASYSGKVRAWAGSVSFMGLPPSRLIPRPRAEFALRSGRFQCYLTCSPGRGGVGQRTLPSVHCAQWQTRADHHDRDG
jgi:hypothetical protein